MTDDMTRMTDDLAFTSAAELAGIIARREASPVEIVDLFLERIEQSQARVNAFITVCADEARAAAQPWAQHRPPNTL